MAVSNISKAEVEKHLAEWLHQEIKSLKKAFGKRG